MRPLYCDESLIPVADGLRRRGWTVHTARAKGRLGDSDREHLPFALKNDWLLVTFDDNFLSLIEGSGLDHAGLIYVQQAGRDIGEVLKAADVHLESREQDNRGIHYC